jgi:hypothetical protein
MRDPRPPGLLDALLDDLLDDAGPLDRHRDVLADERRDLVAALVVPASTDSTNALVEGLRPGDAGIRVVLAARSIDDLRAARTPLLDLDAVELVGVRIGFPGFPGSFGFDGPDPAAATLDLLDELDSGAPAWITVPTGPAAGPVLDVLAEDGAEYAALDVSTGTPAEISGVLHRLVGRRATFRVAGTAGVVSGRAADGPPGLLAVLTATLAALRGTGTADLAAVLSGRDPTPLVAQLRTADAAEVAALRAVLVAVEVPDAAEAATELDALGLRPPTDV